MSDILYSKLRLEVPQALDGEIAIITNSKGITRTVEMSSPITDVMVAGMDKYRVQIGTTIKDVSFGYGQIKKLEAKWFDTLENESWTSIAYLIKDGKFALGASVGDTKTFVINNKTYTAEVVSINDGTGDAAQWYPANTVDFICKELYETEYKFNSSDTNSGGFPSSSVKSSLNGTVYSSLPSDLKNVIINKSHSYQSGSYNSSSKTWSSSMTTLSTKLWLPTYYELTGTADTKYAAGETNSNNKAYTLASKIKKKSGASANSSWWTGSPYTNYIYVYSVGSNTGTMVASYPSNTKGVPICFRIG